MRMWMVDPRVMCRKHLLGEHVELHMFVGHLRRGRRIEGFIAHNCVEPKSLERRHAALVRELQRRGYRHRSPLRHVHVRTLRLYSAVRVDRYSALRDLTTRCTECAARNA
jgi:hypothetical protein